MIQHFSIYQSPKDYPGKFVVRRWVINPDLPDPIPDRYPVAVEDTLDLARLAVPGRFRRVPHQRGEDPVIVETWI
jgi:hypothetical protein